MHRLRHLRTLVFVRLTSVLLLTSYLLSVGTLMLASYSVVTGNRTLLNYSMGLFFLCLFSWLSYRICAPSTQCPLCMMPALLPRPCSRSAKARTFLKSYHLRVAIDVIIKRYFFCPYCGEPSKCEVRERPKIQEEAKPKSTQSSGPESW